jgi:hypothetical protein
MMRHRGHPRLVLATTLLLVHLDVCRGRRPDVVAQCLKGCQLGGKSFKVYPVGYNLVPFFKGDVKEPPRTQFLYWSDDGGLLAIRINAWKVSFKEQEHTASTSGKEGSPTSARRGSTTCAPTRSSAAPSRSSTETGWRTACSSSSRRRRWSASGCRPSRTSRSGRSPRASTSTRGWSSCRRRSSSRILMTPRETRIGRSTIERLPTLRAARRPASPAG